ATLAVGPDFAGDVGALKIDEEDEETAHGAHAAGLVVDGETGDAAETFFEVFEKHLGDAGLAAAESVESGGGFEQARPFGLEAFVLRGGEKRLHDTGGEGVDRVAGDLDGVGH